VFRTLSVQNLGTGLKVLRAHRLCALRSLRFFFPLHIDPVQVQTKKAHAFYALRWIRNLQQCILPLLLCVIQRAKFSAFVAVIARVGLYIRTFRLLIENWVIDLFK
jgi:hypothetical protein